jgi:chaperonin cofactor prefoldin
MESKINVQSEDTNALEEQLETAKRDLNTYKMWYKDLSDKYERLKSMLSAVGILISNMEKI